jgi:hypothetical protein
MYNFIITILIVLFNISFIESKSLEDKVSKLERDIEEAKIVFKIENDESINTDIPLLIDYLNNKSVLIKIVTVRKLGKFVDTNKRKNKEAFNILSKIGKNTNENSKVRAMALISTNLLKLNKLKDYISSDIYEVNYDSASV